MFQFENNLTFVTVNQDYLRKLHNVCAEVYYKESEYENKPYVGVLLNDNGTKYVVPLSSAKEKHKTWKDNERDCYLVYEIVNKLDGHKNSVFVEIDQYKYKHILSVLDIKKMIPVVDGVYEKTDININKDDSDEITKYKHLLLKEYMFCLKIARGITEKADRLYRKQKETGKITKFCCDFEKLEKAALEYSLTEKSNN